MANSRTVGRRAWNNVLTNEAIYSTYVASLSPLIWLKLNEAALAATAINYGSGGTNGTNTGVTTGQTGARGPQEAYSFGSADNRIVVPQFVSGNGLNDFFTWHFINTTSFAAQRSIINKNAKISVALTTASKISLTVVYTGGGAVNATAVSTNTLNTGVYHTVLCGIVSNVPYIYLDGVQVLYDSRVNGVGTPASNTNDWFFGTTSGLTQDYLGSMDEILVCSGILNDTVAETLHELRLTL